MELRRTFLTPVILLCLTVAGSPCWADDSPPFRAGRVAAIDGGLSLRQNGGDWTTVGLNDPVAAGMSARTGGQARAILRAGAETVAVAPASEVDVARLDSENTQLALRQGRIAVRIAPEDKPRNIEVDLPHGAVWLSTPGEYDIAAGDERNPPRVAALAGAAHVVAEGVDSTIAAGAALVLNGAKSTASDIDAAANDEFSAWRRNAAAISGQSALRHVSAELTGYEALDGDGGWENVSGYGAVWFPRDVPENWAPYRYGHWRWIAPWGWSWIDDMPWGFATSHFGRWANIPEVDPLDPSMPGPRRWGWLPGGSAADPLYAPALVAFLGTAGVGLSSIDGPAVAWFPLAPGDVYWPRYTGDIATIRRLNQGTGVDAAVIEAAPGGELPTAIVDRDYANRRFATAIPRAMFLAGRPVPPALVALPERRLENAPLLAGSPQLAPAPPRIAIATVAAASRLSVTAAPKVVRAVQKLARLLAPRTETPVAHSAVLLRPEHWRPAVTALSGHAAATATQPVRANVIAAVSRSSRPRLHVAEARLRTR